MLWFAIELLGLLFGALVVGLLVGWLIWARSLRKARRVHQGDLGVLRTQVASLGDESRRLQQRFVGVATELDTVRSEKEQQANENTRTREAFMVSQTNLAAAESEMASHQQHLGELQTRVTETEARLNDTDRELAASRAQAETRAHEIATLESTLAGLTTELTTAQHELENVRARYEANRTDIEGARRQLTNSAPLAADGSRIDGSSTSPLTNAVFSNQQLRRALDAATARANDAEAKSIDVRRQLAALRQAHDHDVNALRASLLDVNTRASADRQRGDTAEAQRVSAEGVVRTASVETVSTLRRLWSATQAELNDTKTRLKAAERRRADLERVANESRAGYVAKLVEVGGASADREVLSQRIADEHSAAEQAFRRRIADLEEQYAQQALREGEREEAHRVAIDQWRRDLHRRFDEIEEHKERVVAREAEIEQTKQKLVEAAAHHEHETQRLLAEREAELTAANEADRRAALEALASEHATSTLAREAETASEHAAQLAALQQRHDALTEQHAHDSAAYATQLDDLQQRLLDGQAELERVAYERHLLEEERDRFANLAADMEADREMVRDQLHLATQTHREQVAVLRANVEALEQQLEERLTALDHGGEQINALVTQRDELARLHESLSDEHQRMSAAHVAAVADLDRAREDHAGSSELVATLQAELAQIGAERDVERSRLRELEQELAHRSDVIDATSSELDSARRELASAHGEMVAVRQQVAAQQESATALAERVAALTGERDTLTRERDQLVSDHRQLVSRHDELTGQHDEVRARVADLTAGNSALVSSLDDVRRELDTANASIVVLTDQLERQRRDAEAVLHTTTQSYNEQLTLERDRLAEANEQRERAQREVETAQAESHHARSAHEADLTAIAAERETHAAERQARREIESRHTELNEDHSALTSRHESLTHDHQALVQQHDSLRDQHENLSFRHTQLVAERDAIESHHDALLADHGGLQTEHANLAADRDELLRNIELMSANHEELRARLETLTEDHSSLSSHRDEVLAERDEIDAQRRSVDGELSTVRSQLEEVSRRLGDTETSLGRSQHERAEIDERLAQLDAELHEEIRALRVQNETARRHAELVEAEASRDRAVAASQMAELESDRRRFRTEADGWGRELQQLRRLHDIAVARSQRPAMPEPAGAHASAESATRPPQAPRRLRTLKGEGGSALKETATRDTNGSGSRGTNGNRVSGRESAALRSVGSHSVAALVPKSARQGVPAGADELQRIEGIGPKIEAALKAAGVTTFVRLQAATSDQLRDALASAGLTFAPSLSTWSKQASYLVMGDEDGFQSYTDVLVAGRDERSASMP